MPKLKIVAACEKTIVDQSGPVSLIGLFQRMNIQLQDAPLPEKAISPTWWSIFCLWENDPKEVGQEFTQITRVFAPDETLWMEFQQPFKNEDVENGQTKTSIVVGGIPIWAEGYLQVRVFLKGDDVELGSYRFIVAYQKRQQDTKVVTPVV
jgi:hypothetical protein